MTTLFQLFISILFAPFHLSQIISDRKFKKTMLALQYPYLPLAMLAVGIIAGGWLIVKFFKTILNCTYILLHSQNY
jgi:hypothetical protein